VPELIRKIKLDHQILFFMGFIYYLVIPPIIGSFGFFADYPGMSSWFSDYNEINSTKLIVYYCIIFFYLVAFNCGSFFVSFIQKVRQHNQHYKVCLNLNCLSVPILIAILFIALKNSELLFTGYSESYDSSVLGPLTTLTMLQTYIVIHHYVSHSTKTASYLISLITLLIASTILMGFGSRMYVLIPILAFVIYRINFSDNTISLYKYLFLGVAILFSMLAIGAWRIGADFDPAFLAYLFFAEPTFTWWSASTFLANNDLLPFALPTNFMSSVLNFAPGFLFNNKSDYLVNLNTVYSFSAPLGAESIFLSVQGNFGYLYGICYMFLLGFYFGTVKVLSNNNVFLKTYYVLICAVLPFQFFRDPFSVINKQLFWNMLLLPALLYTASFCWHMATKSYCSNRRSGT